MAEFTASDLRGMLRKRYPSPRWALFEEVNNRAGFSRTRACDAIGMSVWPSDGLELHGFEIKCSRADWLNELRDPDKSATFRRYCDRWWLVASSRKVVDNDLPSGWGMLWPRGNRLVVSRGAPKLDPEPMPRSFLAALFKRALEGYEQRDILEARYLAGYEAGQKSRALESGRLERSLEELRATVAAFCEASGIKLSSWRKDGKQIGEAVATVLKLRGRYGELSALENKAKALQNDAANIGDRLVELRAVAADVGLLSPEKEKAEQGK